MILFSVCMLSIAYYLAVLFIRAVRVLSQIRRSKTMHVSAVGMRSEEADGSAPAQLSVTVMQPILSGDPELEHVLLTNVSNHLESVRWLWLVDDDDVVANDIAARIARGHGNVSVLSCPKFAGDYNPKIAKLRLGLESVTTDYVAVLDDDTYLSGPSLLSALHGLEQSDLCTGLPCYQLGSTSWSGLVAHFVNNNSSLTYLGSQSVTHPLTINGMFYVMRRDYLSRGDLFGTIVHEVCDDLAIANAVYQRNGRIRQSDAVVYLSTHVANGRAYFRLMHRWMLFASVLVNNQSWAIQAQLAFYLGVPQIALWIAFVSMIWLLSTTGLSSYSLVAVSLIVLMLAVRYVVLRGLLGKIAPANPGLSFFVSLVSELLQPIHWLHALVNRVIIWRTRTFWVGWKGEFRSVTSK